MRATPLVVAMWAMFTVSVAAGAESLRDPTRPPGAGSTSVGGGKPQQPGGPVLQSTLVSPLRKTAVISGRQVKVGDTFQGATVVDITPYEVRLDRGGRETTLRLLPKLVKE